MVDRGLIVYGQSLYDGVTSTSGLGSALTVVQPFSNVRLNAAQDALVPLIEGLPADSDRETPASGAANTARAILGAEIFSAIPAAVAGANMAQLSPGHADDYFGDLTTAVANLIAATIAAGRTVEIEWILFGHGESDQQTGNLNYGAELLQLQIDIETMVNTAQGTSGRIPMLVSQVSSFGLVDGGSNLALQQLEAVRAARRADPAAPRLLMATSRSYFASGVDQLHGINTDYQAHGLKLGRAIARLAAGGEVMPFAPTQIEASGTDVDVRLAVPTPPLALNSAIVSQRVNEGFELYAPSILNEFAAIQSVSLPSSEVARLALNVGVGRDWNNNPARVRYAYSGGVGNQLGAQLATSANGNLVDSAADGYGLNHALHFDDAVDFDTDPKPATEARYAIQFANNTRMTIPTGAGLDFTTRCVWSFIVRIDDVTLHNRWIAERNANNWSGRWFSTGNPLGRLVWNIGGGANSYASAGGQFQDGRFHHVVVDYDGDAGPTNADRLKFVIDGIRDLGGIYAGTIPASLSQSALPINFGAAANAVGMTFLHFGMWVQPPATFTAQQLWQSGLVRSPIEPDGTGGIPLPDIWIRPDASDGPSGVANHGTLGNAYDATTLNMVAGNFVQDLPEVTAGDARMSTATVWTSEGTVGGGQPPVIATDAAWSSSTTWAATGSAVPPVTATVAAWASSTVWSATGVVVVPVTATDAVWLSATVWSVINVSASPQTWVGVDAPEFIDVIDPR